MGLNCLLISFVQDQAFLHLYTYGGKRWRLVQSDHFATTKMVQDNKLLNPDLLTTTVTENLTKLVGNKQMLPLVLILPWNNLTIYQAELTMPVGNLQTVVKKGFWQQNLTFSEPFRAPLNTILDFSLPVNSRFLFSNEPTQKVYVYACDQEWYALWTPFINSLLNYNLELVTCTNLLVHPPKLSKSSQPETSMVLVVGYKNSYCNFYENNVLIKSRQFSYGVYNLLQSLQAYEQVPMQEWLYLLHFWPLFANQPADFALANVFSHVYFANNLVTVGWMQQKLANWTKILTSYLEKMLVYFTKNFVMPNNILVWSEYSFCQHLLSYLQIEQKVVIDASLPQNLLTNPFDQEPFYAPAYALSHKALALWAENS